jgi:hypothetical protein
MRKGHQRWLRNISVPLIQVEPRGYFAHISITLITPVVYSPRLGKRFCPELFGSSNGHAKLLSGLGQGGGLISVTATRQF